MRSATTFSLFALSPLGALALPCGSNTITQASRPDRDLDGAVWKSLTSNAGRVKRQSSWDPPSELVKPLQEVWDHTVESYNNGQWDAFKNYGYDIIVAAEGYDRRNRQDCGQC